MAKQLAIPPYEIREFNHRQALLPKPSPVNNTPVYVPHLLTGYNTGYYCPPVPVVQLSPLSCQETPSESVESSGDTTIVDEMEEEEMEEEILQEEMPKDKK